MGTDIDALIRRARVQLQGKRQVQPVAIVGPSDGGVCECAAAYETATVFGTLGIPIICGGRGGVMESASRGATEAGGIAIGLLPEGDLSGANRYLTVALPTGIGEMRNALIARSCVCLVAVGGGMGTLSEMALGLKWDKPVFTLFEEIRLPGAIPADGVHDLVGLVVAYLCQRPDRS